MPVQGLTCTVLADGVMLGCCATDASGQAVISIPDGFPEIADAELIVSGYNCLPHHYPLMLLTGLDEPGNNQSAVRIMPNPFSDHLKLSFSLVNAQPVKIEIYQASGQKIGDYAVNGRQGINEMTIDASNWPEGMLQARIMAGTGVIHTKLLHLSR
jgi:hypothetical protein